MARKAEWVAYAVEAIREVEAIPGDLYLDRARIQKLLNLGPSRTKQLMGVMGAEKAVDGLVVHRENFLRYLNSVAAPEIEQERQRRVKFAQTLRKLEKERIQKPPLSVELPTPVVREMCRRSLDRLPEESILLEPGMLRIAFIDGQDLLQKLAKLATAIAVNQSAFLEVTAAKEKVKTA